ncbi:MAG: LytTR family DNA-binding domain-containing protein [Bacteroidota bacterium]
MKALIIEDEILAADRLEALLHRYDPQIRVEAKIGSIELAIDWLQRHPVPDLILADIHLSDGLCFELFRKIPIKSPVIFTTSYDKYALEAFEVHSIAYLLKPVRYEKLVLALQKLQNLKSDLGLSWNPVELAAMIQQQTPSYKQRFLVKNGQQIRTIKTADIRYFYADQKLTLLVSKEGRRFPLDHSLDRLMPLLDPQLFFRANRRFIIQLDAVNLIRPYFKGRLKLELQPSFGEDIIISSDKTPSFKEWLDQ